MSATADSQPYRIPLSLRDLVMLDLLELTGSTTATAEMLTMSQPSVSRRYRSVARDLGLARQSDAPLGRRFADAPWIPYLRRGINHHRLAIDDATRIAYVEVLADEQQATAIGFMSRAVAWFNGQGVECRQVMSDNGPAYVSRRFAKACKPLGLKHIRTRLYTPRTNGKAERFTQTLCREWAYGMPFQNSEERNQWLP